MYELSNQHIASWRREKDVFVPNAIDIGCPYCNRFVSFAVPAWHPAAQNTRIAPVRCPGCNAVSTFFLTNHVGRAGTLDDDERLFIDRNPSGKASITEILDNEEIKDALKRAYISTINVFNLGEWSATAVLARRLLEGITKSILDEKHQSLPLAKQIELLPTVKDLNAPITTIADAIRKGGNLGAHFDLEKEPSHEVAELMVELVEELIEYFFVLPERIQKLHETIENLGKDESA